MQGPLEPDLVIRLATIEDIPAIQAVHRDAVKVTAARDYPPEIIADWASPVSPESIKRAQDDLTFGRAIYVVANLAGQMVGFGVLVVQIAEIGAVYVAPSRGRRGVGSALLEALEELARRKGLTELRLDSSLTAENFYLKHGYMALKRIDHRLRSGREMVAVKMVKTL